MVVTFSPEKTTHTPSSLVYNQLSRDIAFDIQVYEIEFTNTKPTLIPLDEPALWVFPPTLFLKKGESQKLQFRWLDKALPVTDKSYQVSLIEQPIGGQTASKESQLTMLLNVNLIVHIDQQALVPHLIVKQPYIEGDSIKAQVENQGNGASRLSEYKIIVKFDDQIVNIQKQQLKAAGYDVFFAPKNEATIKIPLPEGIKARRSSQIHLDLVQ